MEDVTDAAFRQLIARLGKPDVIFTEFTSADGLVLASQAGKRVLLKKLLYSESERPIVAQLFSSIPERMEKAAKLCAELGFDGIDINMGCPDRSVEKSGCGAALMKNPSLARELIRASRRGAVRTRTSDVLVLPISIKTRIGYNTDELDSWLPALLSENPAAVTIHARTRKEMSDVPAHWEAITKAVSIRNSLGSSTLIVGNGDVQDLDDARAKAMKFGCDGVMLGRAMYGRPWLFSNSSEWWNGVEEDRKQKTIAILIEHIKLFDELLGDTSNFATMKKHFKAYISGWVGAKELRVRLMEISTAKDAIAILQNQV